MVSACRADVSDCDAAGEYVLHCASIEVKRLRDGLTFL